MRGIFQKKIRSSLHSRYYAEASSHDLTRNIKDGAASVADQNPKECWFAIDSMEYSDSLPLVSKRHPCIAGSILQFAFLGALESEPIFLSFLS